MKFHVPGVLWVALVLMLPQAIAPFLEQFFPTNAYPISAGIVLALNLVAMAVRLAYPDESAKVPTVPPGAAADFAPAAKERSTVSKVLFGV